MSEFLTNLVAFIVVISILVTVHEYGHYIVGRWTGMKVLRFSVGFGNPIWRRYGKGPIVQSTAYPQFRWAAMFAFSTLVTA